MNSLRFIKPHSDERRTTKNWRRLIEETILFSDAVDFDVKTDIDIPFSTHIIIDYVRREELIGKKIGKMLANIEQIIVFSCTNFDFLDFRPSMRLEFITSGICTVKPFKITALTLRLQFRSITCSEEKILD